MLQKSHRAGPSYEYDTFAEPQEFEQYLRQHGLRLDSELPSDAAKVPPRGSEL